MAKKQKKQSKTKKSKAPADSTNTDTVNLFKQFCLKGALNNYSSVVIICMTWIALIKVGNTPTLKQPSLFYVLDSKRVQLH